MNKIIKNAIVFILGAVFGVTVFMSGCYLNETSTTHRVTIADELTNTVEMNTYRDYHLFGHTVSIKTNSETVDFQTVSK